MEAKASHSRISAALADLKGALAAGEAVGCGDLQLSIDRDGTWSYRGSPIRRPALAKLFASILHRLPDGQYWLVTPAERGTVAVADVPFVVVGMEAAGTGTEQVLRFRTNLDEVVTAGADHPLTMRLQPHGDAAPYLMIRNGLEARLARAVYYELVDYGMHADTTDGERFGVYSGGTFFALDSMPTDRISA